MTPALQTDSDDDDDDDDDDDEMTGRAVAGSLTGTVSPVGDSTISCM